MTLDERLHWLGGYTRGLGFWWLGRARAERAIQWLDLWAWEREVAQHDPVLTPHQIAEARAWGFGARAARRLDPAFPHPYPT